MFVRIFRHEWRSLIEDRTAVVVFVIFALVLGYAAFNGQRWVYAQNGNIVEIETEESERLAKLKSDIVKAENEAVAAGKAGEYPGLGPRHPFTVANNLGRRSAVLPPSPLASFAIGQSDIYLNNYKVSAGLKESFMISKDLESPFKLLSGYVDVAFVIVYLFPLLILALGFNLLSGEKEQGILSMLLSNPVSLVHLLLAKIAIRAAVIFIPTFAIALGSLFFGNSGIDVGTIGLWMIAVLVYGLFWIALAVAVNALGHSSATNAVILASVWIGFVVVLPAVVNLTATTLYPVPSRIEFVTAMRGESQAADKRGSELLARYIEDHPEIGAAADTKNEDGKDDFAMLSMAKNDLVARALQPVQDRFNAQLMAQQAVISRFRFVSPAILMQESLFVISGTGISRYRSFVTQVEQFHAEWRSYFTPRMFEKRAVTVNDVTAAPEFDLKDETLADISRRLMAPLLFMLVGSVLIGGLGFRMYRKFAIAH